MRSSIACARCRRSKVKCINNGVNTTCRACGTSGRECTYPTPLPGGGGGGARRESYLPAPNGTPQVPAEAPSSTATTAAPATTVSGETPKRHRPKKSTTSLPTNGVSSRESPRALVDALDPTVLTPKVWTELFEIFQLHFSTLFPFLHPPTFLKPLRQSMLPSLQSHDFGSPYHDRNASMPTPPLSPVLLLAFLALTARFHPQLVSHHSPPSTNRPSNPLVAAAYYASAAANAHMNRSVGDASGLADIQETQALLMLALHYWGECQGAKAWIAVGSAIRSAQLMGLQYESDLDDETLSRSLPLSFEADQIGNFTDSKGYVSSASKEDALVEQEVRRRTFWSCLVMDRYLSNGKHRLQMLNVKDVRVQLPSSERAFLFGEQVRTPLLGEEMGVVDRRTEARSKRHASAMSDPMNGFRPNASSGSISTYDVRYTNRDARGKDEEQSVRWEVGPDEGVVSRFVKVTELYGMVARWSCGGGRRRERYPPWDERSTFYALDRRVAAFRDQLPRDLTLTPANMSAHITSRTSTPYILMHTVLSLCNILLHREYLPFIPLKFAQPEGPLIHSLYPPEYKVPPRYWEFSARQIFKSAHDLVKLLNACQEWGVLVETPLVGFSIYNIALLGVYAIHFPWMDPDGYMCNESAGTAPYNRSHGGNAEAVRIAVEMLGQMRPRLKIADSWFKTIRRVHVYFVRMKKEFRSSVCPPTQRLPTLPEDVAEGGTSRYTSLEQTLNELGKMEDEDQEMLDVHGIEHGKGNLGTDNGSDSGSAIVRDETMGVTEAASDSAGFRQEGWNAINSVAAPTGTGNAANGASPVHEVIPAMPLNMPAPSLQGQHGSLQHQLLAASTGASPPVPSTSPRPHSSQPQHPQQSQQLPGPPVQHASVPWSEEAKSRWLSSLDVHFSGDDLAAFIDGTSCEDWAAAARQHGLGGWLSIVLASGARSSAGS